MVERNDFSGSKHTENQDYENVFEDETIYDEEWEFYAEELDFHFGDVCKKIVACYDDDT